MLEFSGDQYEEIKEQNRVVKGEVKKEKIMKDKNKISKKYNNVQSRVKRAPVFTMVINSSKFTPSFPPYQTY